MSAGAGASASASAFRVQPRLRGPGGGPTFPRVKPGKTERPTAFQGLDPPRNFTISTEDRVRALAADVPAYAARKRGIEDKEADLVETLVALHDELAAKGEPAQAIADAVRAKAAAFDLARLNAKIAKHNRYYPIEANLPIDPATGGFLLFGRRWSPERPWTVTRLLACVDAALAARAPDTDA